MVDDVPLQGWEIVHPIHGEVRMFWLVVLGARVDSAWGSFYLAVVRIA